MGETDPESGEAGGTPVAPEETGECCPECEGTGERDGRECPACEGTGNVMRGLGGG